MWISKEELDALKERISTLEKEQAVIKNYLNTNICLDEQLIKTVKKLNSDFKSIIQNI